jgi:hypothetical protein
VGIGINKQANAWFGGGGLFEIEFQFQLVLSLVLCGVKLSNQARVWCLVFGAKQG